MPDYGPQPRYKQYKRGLPVQFQEHPKSVSLPGKIAAGIWTPYKMVEGMAEGVVESARQFKDWLESDMYRPQTPQSEVRATERMIDIGTPGTSGAKTAGATLGIFGGRGAKVAKKLDAGRWFQSPYDKKFRFEIDDSKMDFPTTEGMGNFRLSEIAPHEELFKAYPQLKDTWVSIDVRKGNPVSGGSFATLAVDIPEIGAKAGDNRIIINAKTPKEGKSTLVHELQHAVQEIEGFARGGSPNQFYGNVPEEAMRLRGIIANAGEKPPKLEDLINGRADWEDDLWLTIEAIDTDVAWDAYNRYTAALDNPLSAHGLYSNLAGEIEAREAAKRMGMTAQDRYMNRPYQNAIPPAQAIVRY